MHVHDEVILDVPNVPDYTNECDTDLENVNRIMATPIKWAPGLDLKGDGYITRYYKKD